VRNDSFSHDLSKGEGLDQKKNVFDVNIVFNVSRGSERSKMKHKHKTVLIDKGNFLHLIE
jgi:translation initiation factor 2-alpha kinase 4